MNNNSHGFAKTGDIGYTLIVFILMVLRMLKKLLMFIALIPMVLGIFGMTSQTYAQGDAFELIPAPEASYGWTVDKLTKPWVKFWEEYNKEGDEFNKGERDLGAAMGSGIITWDTILTLLTQIIKFIANTSMVIGAAMFIYAWYLYVTAVYSWEGQTSKANEAIKDAVIGIVLVIFSYAIQKIVVQSFLS